MAGGEQRRKSGAQAARGGMRGMRQPRSVVGKPVVIGLALRNRWFVDADPGQRTAVVAAASPSRATPAWLVWLAGVTLLREKVLRGGGGRLGGQQQVGVLDLLKLQNRALFCEPGEE